MRTRTRIGAAVQLSAAGDIGRAVARRLAAEGASLVLADLPSTAAQLEAVRKQCATDSRPGGSVTTALFDVTDVAAVRAAISAMTGEAGPPNLLFNNAGYQGRFANTADTDLADAQSTSRRSGFGPTR